MVRSDSQSIHEFIVDFDHVYFSFKKEKLDMSSTVAAFNLLYACKLTEDKKLLVMTAIGEINYDNMRSTLLNFFSNDKIANSISSGDTPVIQESTFYGESGSNQYKYNQKGRSSKPNKNPYPTQPGLNPLSKSGFHTKCNICGDLNHWAHKCPNKNPRFNDRNKSSRPNDNSSSTYYDKNKSSSNNNRFGGSDKVQFTMFVGCTSSNEIQNLNNLVNESKDCAIVDTGCVTTVCGNPWADTFIDS